VAHHLSDGEPPWWQIQVPLFALPAGDHPEPRPSTIPKRLWASGARSRHQPPIIRVSVDHPTIANVSGTAREKSRRTICDFFQKAESDLD
jgi:hypothetical protein